MFTAREKTVNEIVASEANNRTRFIRAQSVTRHLRSNGIQYASEGAYASAVRMANKAGTRTSNGMKYRVPEHDPAADNLRMYLIWEGQTVEQVREAMAFAIMLQKVPFVVMCMGTGMKAPGEGQLSSTTQVDHD